MVSWDSLLRVARFTDLFLFDCKETDRERHRRLTGQPNDLIVRNLRRLHDEGAAICLQCPIVPGLNDGDAHLEGIAALAGSLPRLSGVRVLPYHPLGRGKRAQFGTPSSGLEPAVPTAAQVEGWTARLKNLGVHLL
jgi:pyruvate formate lyase activating enzyme